jgi:hypothetical protein
MSLRITDKDHESFLRGDHKICQRRRFRGDCADAWIIPARPVFHDLSLIKIASLLPVVLNALLSRPTIEELVGSTRDGAKMKRTSSFSGVSSHAMFTKMLLSGMTWRPSCECQDPSVSFFVPAKFRHENGSMLFQSSASRLHSLSAGPCWRDYPHPDSFDDRRKIITPAVTVLPMAASFAPNRAIYSYGHSRRNKSSATSIMKLWIWKF